MTNRRTWARSSGLLILAAAVVVIPANHAIAATTTFTGPWGGGTIAPGDVVVLNNGASVSGNVVADGTLQFNQSAPSLLTISSTISGTGALSLTNEGTLNLTGTTASENTVVLDLTTTASAGLLQIQSGTGDLRVGNSGIGTLNVTGGSVSNSFGHLGYSADSVGNATISGGTWANSKNLLIGVYGTGTLNVMGGRVSSSWGILGGYAGSVGTATVSGGTWDSGPYIFVGDLGTGTLNVTGGSVNTVVSQLGYNAGGVGTATISSGTWNTTDLFVGVFGTGTLNVTGGSITSGWGRLGWYGGGVGTATVSGGTWAIFQDLFVGREGTGGTLNVTSGSVSNSSGYLGYNGDGVGIATVSGGTWTNRRDLMVGVRGIGTLNVTGGRVTSTDGYLGVHLGFMVNCVGTATVSGGMWDNSGNLYVGASDIGTLNVTGGSVSNSEGYLGRNAGSVGTATISSGTWANSSNLYVGNSGTGTLNVTGGSVTNTDGFLGHLSGGVGTVTVSSGTWANSGSLTVGVDGTGLLTISGGLITVGGTLARGANGTINLSSGGNLRIGLGGTTGVLLTDLANNGALIFDRSDASTYSGVISGSGAMMKRGQGSLMLAGPNALTGATTIQQGAVRLAHGSALFASTIIPLTGGTLSLAPKLQTTVGGLNPNAGGLVDVDMGMITVASGLSATDLMAALLSGRAGGSWDGSSGITSSVAAASGGDRTVGWLDNGDGSVTFGFAAAGDTNLDWQVDIIDAANFLAGGRFDTGLPASWNNGDFTYDGVVDILDAASFLSNGLFDAGVYNVATTMVAVPEPGATAVAAAGIGLLGLGALRRKRAG